MKIHFKPKKEGFDPSIEELDVEWVEVVTTNADIQVFADGAGLLVLRDTTNKEPI